MQVENEERNTQPSIGLSRDVRAFQSVADFFEVAEKYSESGRGNYLQIVLKNTRGQALVTDHYQRPATEMKVFCSADYLGLAHHPAVKAAAHAAIDEHGLTVASVPVIGGATAVHIALERYLARYFGYAEALLFPTGHAANMSGIAALCGREDVIFVDDEIHPSMMEGIHLSRARSFRFRHDDIGDLDRRLHRCRQEGHEGNILVVAEGTYGLDGQVSNIAAVIDLAHRQGARVYVDDCQGIGVIGSAGRGVLDLCGDQRPDIFMGAFSKAFGSIGGFIAGDSDVIGMLRGRASSSVFSIGLSPVFAAAALEALKTTVNDPTLRNRLYDNVEYAKGRFAAIGASNVLLSESAIMSIRVVGETDLDRLAARLFADGVWAEILRHPATRKGEERVRFRIRSDHSREDIDAAVGAFARAATDEGIAFF